MYNVYTCIYIIVQNNYNNKRLLNVAYIYKWLNIECICMQYIYERERFKIKKKYISPLLNPY